MSLDAKRKTATNALCNAIRPNDDPEYDWSADMETAVRALLDAAREQMLHDIATKDPRVLEALRAAGLIA